MAVPRGHAMLPLNESDFLDFIYNYFKAEYYPIRSFWSTATADPRTPSRWMNMGHELAPLSFRAANSQAQKDLDSLDFFIRKWKLSVNFVRGLVVRYAKYEVHERLEKKLYESCRLDLMVRKSLEEKHLIDKLWPSPAPRDLSNDLLAQGVQVRKWYGDMFGKYYLHLHALDDFKLRPEVDQKFASSNTLMLVPFVDHLVFGTVEPIAPIIARGAGYSNAKAFRPKKQTDSFGDPDQFEVRFDSPGEITDTQTRSVVRQCQCLKCGSKRDVRVVISVDPKPGATGEQSSTGARRPSNPNISAPRRGTSKTAQRYSPGYSMPGFTDETLPRQSQPPPPPPQPEPANETEPARPSSLLQKKQCLRCTFLNHPDLTACEMCQGELPDALVAKPPSPAPQSKASHSHSRSVPNPAIKQIQRETLRPGLSNRQSLSSTLFSIFPFSQQQLAEQEAGLPVTRPKEELPGVGSSREQKAKAKPHGRPRPAKAPREEEGTPPQQPDRPVTPPNLIDTSDREPGTDDEPELSNHPEMAMMPMTPPPTSSEGKRPMPVGLPQNLMDDFVPVSSPFPQDEEEEDAGWGEMSREEATYADDSDEEEEGGRPSAEGLIDLDAVAREEMGVWGEREDD